MKLSAILRSTALSFVALASSAAFAQTQWAIDSAHSQAAFTIRHMGISNVNGRFGNIAGTIVLDPADVTKSSVKATIDVTTVDTGEPKRDGHLKTADFFDVAKFPTMTFVSKSVSKSGDDYLVQGDLTMHGVTKTVTLKLDAPDKEQIGMDSKLHRGFSATTVLHRQDFGLVWNGTLKSGDNMLGDDVKVQLDIEAVKQ